MGEVGEGHEIPPRVFANWDSLRRRDLRSIQPSPLHALAVPSQAYLMH
jgi:hypothetical protein